jgi:membrane fusion protein (multidrug efflux system)
VRDWVRDAFPGREYTGEVYAVDPGLDPATRSVKLRARLPNPNRELRPGMFARGSVVMSERGCPSSPWCRSASA